MKKQSLYNPQSIKRINDYPDILTVQEASELLGVSTKTVYKLLKEGQIEKKPLAGPFEYLKSMSPTTLASSVNEYMVLSQAVDSGIITYVNGR